MRFDFFNLCILDRDGTRQGERRHQRGLILPEGSSSGRGSSPEGSGSDRAPYPREAAAAALRPRGKQQPPRSIPEQSGSGRAPSPSKAAGGCAPVPEQNGSGRALSQRSGRVRAQSPSRTAAAALHPRAKRRWPRLRPRATQQRPLSLPKVSRNGRTPSPKFSGRRRAPSPREAAAVALHLRGKRQQPRSIPQRGVVPSLLPPREARGPGQCWGAPSELQRALYGACLDTLGGLPAPRTPVYFGAASPCYPRVSNTVCMVL